MFIKQIKHDLAFSQTAFLGMGTLMIGLAIVLRIVMWASRSVMLNQNIVHVMVMLWSFIIFGVIIVSIIQIFQFYKENFFGDAGYLMLTLPVSRGSLLVSKVIVSMLWFNFMAAIGIVMVFIIANTDTFTVMGVSETTSLTLENILNFVRGAVLVNSLVLFLVSAMFFCITLAHSIIMRWRVHGVMAGVVYFLYLAVYFRIGAESFIMGLTDGVGITLVFAGVALLGAWYLLQNKVTV